MDIIEVVTNLIPGSFVRISYVTEPPMKAEYKKKGYRVIKQTSITSRFGINYHNIKEVKENDSKKEVKKTRSSNVHYLIDKYVLINEMNNELYVVTYPNKKGNNAKSIYRIVDCNGNEILTDKDGVKDYLIDSYWNKCGSNQLSIKFKNIKSIGKYQFN